MNFDDVKKLASLPTDTVPLCLAGELVGEIAELERQLADAKPATSVGEASPKRVIVERIAELQERMRESTVDFRLRAFPSAEWSDFYAAMPAPAEGETTAAYVARIRPFQAELLSRSSVDPEMSVEQATELGTLVHGTAWNRLIGACFSLNSQEIDIPNSDAASELIETSEQT